MLSGTIAFAFAAEKVEVIVELWYTNDDLCVPEFIYSCLREKGERCV